MTIENKATLNKGGVFVPLVNRGKDKKLIPWSLINKETVMPSVKHCTSPKYGIDVYVVDKMVNGQKLSQSVWVSPTSPTPLSSTLLETCVSGRCT